MALVRLTKQAASDAGIIPDRTQTLLTTNTYQVSNNKPFLLHFLKSGAGSCTVTLTSPGVSGERGDVSNTVSVAATTGDKLVGPFDPNTYNNISDVEFTLSNVTGLTVAVIELPFTHRRQ